jgi:dynein heavy chain
VFLTKHFSKNYKSVVSELVPAIIKSTLAVHSFVEEKFKKSAIYFHYEFNVRHLTNVFQGILQAKPEAIKDYDNMVKLWVHELERIYGDRLVNAANLAVYRDFVNDHCKKTYTKANLGKFFQKENPEPLVFAQFVASIDDKLYD